MQLRIILFILLTAVFTKVQGQTISKFRADLTASLDKSFDETSLNDMFQKYPAFLTPQSDVTQLTAKIKGATLQSYPLAGLKKEKLYLNNIDNLLNAANPYQRILAYLLIGSSNDRSKEQILLKSLAEEKENNNLFWCGMALLNLNTAHTTPLFDFLVKNEDFGDPHMLPLYFRLNKDSLRQTAFNKCSSADLATKILAIQILSLTGKDGHTEQIVLNAIKTWDDDIKGYAIYTAKELKIGHLLSTLRPTLENKKTRTMSLEALAASPTKEDRNYILSLANREDSVDNDLLDCFLKVKTKENATVWLKLLASKNVSKDYYFSVIGNKYISSDELLPDLEITLLKTKNEKVIQGLVAALQGRKDDTSTTILIKFLKHNDPSVRYWSASALKGNKTPKLKQALPGLIADEQNRTVALVDLLIENNISNLQPMFEKIYESNKSDLDWQRSSIEYLSNFPLPESIELFRGILKNKDEDFAIKYNAALGLGRSRDTASIDLLIEVCEEARKASDINSRTYLTALAMIKGDKAKAEIETFLNSDEQVVAELARQIIAKWN